MPQLLLIPDPRPLVERLGVAFFRDAPQCPGVYLMRDDADTVLYVGKAKNLRKRLGNYRVANPERLPRRHLRLLRQVSRIELQECADEVAALAREAELLRELRPKFNRAGTWPGPPRFLAWRVTEQGLEVMVTPSAESEWQSHGPFGAGAMALRSIIVRLFWSALHPGRGLFGMPAGWFDGHFAAVTTIPRGEAASENLEKCNALLEQLFAGAPTPLLAWVSERTIHQAHPCEVAVRDADLEAIVEFAATRFASVDTRV